MEINLIPIPSGSEPGSIEFEERITPDPERDPTRSKAPVQEPESPARQPAILEGVEDAEKKPDAA